MVLDILVRPVDLPQDWAGTAVVESIQQNLGGNGANSAYTLGKMGVEARLVGLVGPDAFGDFVLDKLRSAGVDTSGIRRSVAPTATTVVLVNGRGDRRFLHRLGASGDMFLEPDDFEREILPGMTHYHLGTPFTMPRMRAVHPALLERAHARGLSTSLDTQWDFQGKWMETLSPCLRHADILFVNEDEARMLTGYTEPAAVVRALRDCGARTIVLKMGGRGSAVFGADFEFHAPGFSVPVVDTTGAGDCFAGAYVAALQRGKSHPEAAVLANAVGAMVVETLGAVEGVRDWDETVARASAGA
jgi:sugar/nucleoside kinase (ribokinase family)